MPARPPGIVLLSTVLALSGCAELPGVTPLDVDAHARDRLAATLDLPRVQQALQDFHIPHDPASPWTLDQLTVMSWELRPEITMARAEIEAAQAAEQVAGQRPNPVLSLTPEFVINPAGGVIPWVLAATASLVTQTNDKRALAVTGAKADTATRMAANEEIFWTLRTEVRQAAVNLVAAETAHAHAVQIQDLRDSYSTWVRKRVVAGNLGRGDLLFAESEAIAARMQATRIAGSVITARSQLARALGLPMEAIASVKLAAWEPSHPQSPDLLDHRTLRETALVNRLDVRRTLAEYGRADVDYRLAVANRHPDITLLPGTTYDQGAQKIALGLTATLPLFDDHSAAIAKAEARRRVAISRFDTVQTQALATIDTALASYRLAFESWQEAAQVVTAQEKLQARDELRFQQGAIDRGTLLSARLAALQSRGTTLEAQRLLEEAAAGLENAMQRPFWPDSLLHTPTPEAQQ